MQNRYDPKLLIHYLKDCACQYLTVCDMSLEIDTLNCLGLWRVKLHRDDQKCSVAVCEKSTRHPRLLNRFRITRPQLIFPCSIGFRSHENVAFSVFKSGQRALESLRRRE